MPSIRRRTRRWRKARVERKTRPVLLWFPQMVRSMTTHPLHCQPFCDWSADKRWSTDVRALATLASALGASLTRTEGHRSQSADGA